MKKNVCQICGYVELKGEAPEKCPSCGAPKDQFQYNDDAINEPKDKDNLSELEKKHIPVISVERDCDEFENCAEVHAKMGDIVHPMQDEHFIMFVDFYKDDKFTGRVKLTPQLQPAGGVFLKEASGKITAVSHCNKHGNYIKEIEV